MLKFTGERVVLPEMRADDPTVLEHIARYDLAKPFCEGEKVLDCACGSGYGAKMLNAEGLDVSAEAVEFAIDTYGIRAGVFDLENGLPDVQFDVITSFETIEHLINPDYFLSDVAKKCKYFIFSIPLNNPSAFHKRVYNLEQAQSLIAKYFTNVKWYEQTGTDIIPLESEYPTFLIGIAKN
jgi:2-polyprenyl-3-methyl-5-hydroxy-6-metoxy-1,4-benzoquinol methylase